MFHSSYPSVLKGYLDANWVTNREDYASTSGWIHFLGCGAISQASKRQTCIADSTMVAKFVGLATANKEAK